MCIAPSFTGYYTLVDCIQIEVIAQLPVSLIFPLLRITAGSFETLEDFLAEDVDHIAGKDDPGATDPIAQYV